jgi:hypothetical protein
METEKDNIQVIAKLKKKLSNHQFLAKLNQNNPLGLFWIIENPKLSPETKNPTEISPAETKAV